MGKNDILNEITFDVASGTLNTKVWSFTKAKAMEKALNRIDFKARSMGRDYCLLEELTSQQRDPDHPEHVWQCITRALLV